MTRENQKALLMADIHKSAVEAAVLAEREACAQIAENIATELFRDLSAKGDCHRAADIIAQQIRARCDVNITKSEG